MDRIARAMRDNDARELRAIAKEYIYRAVETGDRELASKAVIAYALSKLVSKVHVITDPRWGLYRKKILEALEKELPPDRVAGLIAAVDEEMGNYVHSLIDKARVKMASDAYAAGLSLRAAAELTGADISELYDYVGKTTIHDEDESRITLSDRVNALRRLLG